MSGIFVSVEGGEGVGKSVFCTELSRRLTSLSLKVELTHEPGGTPMAQEIRKLFLNPIEGEVLDPLTEIFLVSAARAQHISHKIRPWLKSGSWVISDRYYDSTRVYQGRLGGLAPSVVENVIMTSVDGMHPHVTFLLDCDTDTVMARLAKRHGDSDRNRFDGAAKDVQKKLRDSFCSLAKDSDRIVVLDASQSPQQVVEEAVAVLKERNFLETT